MIAGPPPLALSAAPERIELSGAAAGAVTITNPSGRRTVVEASLAGFALDLRGRPHIVAHRDRSVGIAVSPRHVALAPGRAATVTVSSRVGRRAAGGDHVGLVVLTTRPRTGSGVGVRMRIGVVVVVRVAGAVRRVVELTGVRRRAGVLELGFRNGGNVIARIGARRFRIVLTRGLHVLAVLRPPSRELLPATRGVVAVRWPRRIAGRVRARVEVDDGAGTILRSSLDLSRPRGDR